MPSDRMEAREHVKTWIALERMNYADTKYADGSQTRDELVEEMTDGGFTDRWVDFALNYVKRAQLLGADTLPGRQAMGKAVVTLMHMLETAVQVHGEMPQPGMSSTEGAPPWLV